MVQFSRSALPGAPVRLAALPQVRGTLQGQRLSRLRGGLHWRRQSWRVGGGTRLKPPVERLPIAVASGAVVEEHQSPGAVLAVLLDLALHQHPERLAREVVAVNRLRVQHVGGPLFREATLVEVEGVELRPQVRQTLTGLNYLRWGRSLFCQLQSVSSMTAGDTFSRRAREAARSSSSWSDRPLQSCFAPSRGPVEPTK
jgi:hypothetical protein